MSDLIDREAVREFIKSYRHSTDVAFDMEKRLDEIPTASPWHRVEEPPKEEYRTYLVYTDTGYMCSCRWTNNMYGLGESDRWGWSIEDVPQFQKVTHWMPIEPPKEDA